MQGNGSAIVHIQVTEKYPILGQKRLAHVVALLDNFG